MTMKKQRALCDQRGVPFFAPDNGRCFDCKRVIADTDKEHITGCPYCGYSFCD